MKLQVKGKDYPLDSGYFVEDLDNYYSYIELQSPGYIESDKVQLDDMTVFIIRRIMEDKSFKYLAVSEKTYNLLNAVYQPFIGETTVLKLLANLGLSYNKKLRDSAPSYWVLPKLRLKSIIDILNKYVTFGNGAAPRFYVDINGELSYIDYKSSYEKSPGPMSANVLKDSTYIDWILEVPGILDLYYSDCNGFHKETITLKKNYGRACQRIMDNTGKYVKMFKQRHSNLFFTNYYTSRTLEVNEVVGSFMLGDAVTVNDVQKFIISGIRIPILISENPSTMSARLVCPKSLEP